MYWAKIKGRFKGSAGASQAQRRIYLTMKYGSLWRAKTQIRLHLKNKDSHMMDQVWKVRENNQISDDQYSTMLTKLNISPLTKQNRSEPPEMNSLSRATIEPADTVSEQSGFQDRVKEI